MAMIERWSGKLVALLLALCVPVLGWTVKQVIDQKSKQSATDVTVAMLQAVQATTTEQILTLQRAMVANSTELAAAQKQVTVNAALLNNLEHDGSSGLRAHERVDDQREVDDNARIGRLELAVDKIAAQSEKWSEVANDIRWIKAELQREKGVRP